MDPSLNDIAVLPQGRCRDERRADIVSKAIWQGPDKPAMELLLMDKKPGSKTRLLQKCGRERLAGAHKPGRQKYITRLLSEENRRVTAKGDEARVPQVGKNNWLSPNHVDRRRSLLWRR